MSARNYEALTGQAISLKRRQVFASKYKTYLPAVNGLVQEMKRELDLAELEKRLKNNFYAN